VENVPYSIQGLCTERGISLITTCDYCGQEFSHLFHLQEFVN